MSKKTVPKTLFILRRNKLIGITHLQAAQLYHYGTLSQRVSELRWNGYVIDGPRNKHGACVYRLVSEPAKERAA